MSNSFHRLFSSRPGPAQHPVGGCSPFNGFESDDPQAVSNKKRSLQRKSFKQRPASPEPARGSRGISSPGLAMACSLKDSLQGFRGMFQTSPDPTNQPPTSHTGQAHRPPGSSIAHLQLVQNSTATLRLQPAACLSSTALLRLPENSNHPALTQAQCCGKRQNSCGNHRSVA